MYMCIYIYGFFLVHFLGAVETVKTRIRFFTCRHYHYYSKIKEMSCLTTVRECRIIIPPAHPVSSAALWPSVCWEQVGGNEHWAQVRGNPAPPLEASLELSHAWRWRAQHLPKLSPVRLLTKGIKVKNMTEKCIWIIDSDMFGNTYSISIRYICKLQVRLNRWVLNIGM